MRFYFDFISPYAFLAWQSLPSFRRETGATIEIVPVLFAALLDHHGTKGPAEIPAKRTYVFKDANRKAEVMGFGPVVPPPAHPFNPLLALRLSSLPFDDQAARERMIDAFFRATWGGEGGVDTPERVAAILERLGLPASRLIAEANADENKLRLRAQTDAAIEAGVFGVPTLLVKGEVFWGVDAMPFAAARWAGHDVVDTLDLGQWSQLPASATRRG
jgi:2-hydroxychromene-2-carboxylate isomerase